MKSIILTLLIALASITSVFADNNNDEPIGLSEMKSILLNLDKPSEAVGLTFKLSAPVGFENKALTVLPTESVETKLLSKGNYIATILKAESFIDINYYDSKGLIKLKKIEWSWTNGSTKGPGGEVQQACVSKLVFKVNNKEITEDTLKRFKDSNTKFEFIFNKNILKQSEKNSFEFTRLTNDEATVTLNLYNDDNTTIFSTIKSDPLATCNLNAKQPDAPEEYQWSSWTEWNSCSATCGGGKQSRTRVCLTENDGLACVGNNNEIADCNTQSCQFKSTPFNKEQSEEIKYKDVSINIIKSSKLTMLNRKGTADYEVGLTNPYNRTIRCNINIVSTSGSFTPKSVVVDQKSHLGVVVEPFGLTKLTGTINILKTGKDLGLNWTPKGVGQMYDASGCVFLSHEDDAPVNHIPRCDNPPRTPNGFCSKDCSDLHMCTSPLDKM